ncbi:MAG: hypothetical protein IT210_10190 [Armatimonadetes bacterium]|nr:hypothetical protein [Armatimonadota bacterium]
MIGYRCRLAALFTCLAAFGSAQAQAKEPTPAKMSQKKRPNMKMHVVPVPLHSYRLLSMSMDEDGFIWVGSIHRMVHRYDPHTGDTFTLNLPYKATVSACICSGKKVYMLGQTYPRLIVYHRDSERFEEMAYPSPDPDVWYGTGAAEGRYLYLFDRKGAGIVKWDTASDSGTVIPYPYRTPFPGSGRYEPRDKAVWCYIWDMQGGQYVPLGLARLDAATDKFTGYYPFPSDAEKLEPYADPGNTLFIPYTLKGHLVPFDFKAKQWGQFMSVPGFGERFAFIGGSIMHDGRSYHSLSTYDGTETGCDGKPYHFLNAILEFDPAVRKFRFLALEKKGAYCQIAYMLSAGGHFYATGSNIREPDGSLNRDRAGEIVFWQTRPLKK